MRKLTASLVAFMLLVVSGAQAVDSQDERCFRLKTNDAREAAGVRPLAADYRVGGGQSLNQIAQTHSDQMRDDETIYHSRDLAGDYKRAFGGYEYGGENVGMGPDCASIFNAFMGSPGHRDNIEDKNYTKLGVGVAVGKDNTLYVTLDFLTPKSSKPVRPRTPPTSCP